MHLLQRSGELKKICSPSEYETVSDDISNEEEEINTIRKAYHRDPYLFSKQQIASFNNNELFTATDTDIDDGKGSNHSNHNHNNNNHNNRNMSGESEDTDMEEFAIQQMRRRIRMPCVDHENYILD